MVIYYICVKHDFDFCRAKLYASFLIIVKYHISICVISLPAIFSILTKLIIKD